MVPCHAEVLVISKRLVLFSCACITAAMLWPATVAAQHRGYGHGNGVAVSVGFGFGYGYPGYYGFYSPVYSPFYSPFWHPYAPYPHPYGPALPSAAVQGQPRNPH